MATETTSTLVTLMNKEVQHVLSDEEKARLKEVEARLYTDYDYDYSNFAVEKATTVWNSAKGWMTELFKRHPFYNGNFQIVIPANLKRPIDTEGIEKFRAWAVKQYDKGLKANQIMIGLHNYGDYERAVRNMASRSNNCPVHGTLMGETYNQIHSEYLRMSARLQETEEKFHPRMITIGDFFGSTYDEFYVSFDTYQKRNIFGKVLQIVLNISNIENGNLITEETSKRVNEKLENGGFTSRAIAGQKIPRFVGKLLREVGLNKVVDIQKQTWMDNDGEVHDRIKDMGYNYYFALLGDSLSPDTYPRDVVISWNKVDFLTMSFGYKWASCHTIDVNNKRKVGDHQYQGCYSGGTMSYALDPSSFIVYVRPTEAQIKENREEDLPMEMQSKWKRCVFMMGEDKLIQSRVYPDGRDGGDEGIAAQLRAIVQKVVADCLETPNMWTLKKGCSTADSEIDDGYDQIHYPDYCHYGDVNTSYLRRINGDLNHNKIKVGVSAIICPYCGEEHFTQENIECSSCREEYKYHCDCCGEGFNGDDYYTEDGRHYCCMECAERDGYRSVSDTDYLIHENDVVSDLCTGEDYSANYAENNGVYTYEGYWYCSEYTAKADGNRWCKDIDKWSTDFVETVSGRFYHNTNDLIEVDGNWYESDDEVVEAGYTMDDNGNWVAA